MGPENALRFEIEAENLGLKPYIHVRGRLEALIGRPVMYQLVELGEHIELDGVSMFSVRSNGEVFPIMRSDALEKASV